MSIVLNGTTGVTTPDVTSDGALKIDASAPDDSLVVNSSGNVGIGTTSPSSFYSLADNLVVGTGSGGNGLTVYSGSADSGFIGFNDTVSASMQAFIQYNHSGDYMAFAPNGGEKMRIDSSGRLLINRTAASGVDPYSKLHVLADSAVSAVTIQIGTNGYNGISLLNASGTNVGGIVINSSSTAYNTSSDYRLKENWVAVADASTRVNALKPVNFAWKADGSRVDGFLAHELAEVVPEAVSGEKDAVDAEGNPEYQGIDQSKLVPLLTAALQEALAKIDDLTARVSALEASNV